MSTTQTEQAKRHWAWRERRKLRVFLITLLASLIAGLALYMALPTLRPSSASAESANPQKAGFANPPPQTNPNVMATLPPEAAAGFARGAEPAGPARDGECLMCHQNKTMTMDLANGEKLHLYVDQDALGKSVHTKIGCVDCHNDYSGYPHQKRTYANSRAYSLAAYELCQKCHSDVFKKNRDGVHAKALNTITQNAPVCTDCHGFHDVTDPRSPRTVVSQTCAKCHQPVYDAYAKSIHGSALVNDGNTDVPVCTDCHGVHNIADPLTAIFRTQSPETCARCHSDQSLMSKYGLSSNVYTTYSQDFHGVTVKLYETKFPTVWCYKAVCTDCHGVHDILKSSDPASRVAPANLLTTCQQCHKDAGPNFVSAWTGHQEPTSKTSSAVYYVNLFYKLIIPTTMVGVVGFISLDFVRARSSRRRKEKGQ